MSRFHIHIGVDDLAQSVRFYSAVFGVEPTLLKADYAKWALEDPHLHFAISTRGSHKGLDHIGLQADSDAELQAIRLRLQQAGIKGQAQEATTCCYAQSDKYWVQDPTGIPWESFHTLATAPVFSEQAESKAHSTCCAPTAPGSSCC